MPLKRDTFSVGFSQNFQKSIRLPAKSLLLNGRPVARPAGGRAKIPKWKFVRCSKLRGGADLEKVDRKYAHGEKFL